MYFIDLGSAEILSSDKIHEIHTGMNGAELNGKNIMPVKFHELIISNNTEDIYFAHTSEFSNFKVLCFGII